MSRESATEPKQILFKDGRLICRHCQCGRLADLLNHSGVVAKSLKFREKHRRVRARGGTLTRQMASRAWQKANAWEKAVVAAKRSASSKH